MQEIELKFQVPAERRRAVDAAVAARLPRPRQRLQAAYVDTPDRLLAEAGLALRLRREGRAWVQTLKGAAADGMTREEHNVPRGTAAAPPSVDIRLHAGTPAGERLAALLAGRPADALAVLYRTDIHRRSRVARGRQGSVEFAFDEGAIVAGGLRLAVCELEIEACGGSPAAVIATARLWVPRYGLWLDGRTKAQRGDLLARGERMAPPCRAVPPTLARRMTAAEAWRAVAATCARQIVANASQVASGEHADAHVHQLRVGLRRLRSALRLFEGWVDRPGWDDAAGALLRELGGVRDGAVVEAAFSADLRAALASTAGDAALVPAPADDAAARCAAAAQAVRRPAAQALLLDLMAEAAGLGAALPVPVPGEAGEAGTAMAPIEPEGPLRKRLVKRLRAWHRRAAAEASRFAELDGEARHRLRKRIKRLRYALEFCAPVFPRPALRRYLRALRALQTRLGELNDVLVAIEAQRVARERGEHGAWFALGWLAARRDALVQGAAPALAGFAAVRPFWRR